MSVNNETRKAIECARANRANGILYGNDEAIVDLAAEVDRLAFALDHCETSQPARKPLTAEEVRAALHEGHAERRVAEGDNAWTSLLTDRDHHREDAHRLRLALREACDLAEQAYRSMCAAARSPDHWPGTEERLAELLAIAGGAA